MKYQHDTDEALVGQGRIESGPSVGGQKCSLTIKVLEPCDVVVGAKGETYSSLRQNEVGRQ